MSPITTTARQGGFLHLLRLLLLMVSFSSLAAAKSDDDTVYITGTDVNGVTRSLAVDRTPSLYTGSFGDCLGGESLFNITKFDAAYYSDNMTVLFHLDGTTSLRNESLMLVITLEAYGESRYTQTFDPCAVNMATLCPLNASVPVKGYASFALGQMQTSGIPSIALSIPDFDGYVSLQIFANSTEAEIGCFQAVMTNGNTLSLPAIIAPTVGFFLILVLLGSFVTATYGSSVPLMRAHYAHSLSVVLVFETLQSIFLTGALSLHWPSVLVAWWSNFAWSVGLFAVPKLVNSIGTFAGLSGNASQVGGAGSTFINNGGGRLAGQIYTRSVRRTTTHNEVVTLARRKYYNASNPYDYSWGGDPVRPGIPLPGTWQSFTGTLSDLGIPGASAFTLSLFWLVMGALAFPAALLCVKGLFELMAQFHIMRKDRMAYFRTHYVRYTVQIMLRVLLAAFLPLMALAVFQMTLNGSSKTTALAAIVFILNIGALTYLAYSLVEDRISGARARKAAHQEGLFELLRLPGFKPRLDKGKEKNTSTEQGEQQPPQAGQPDEQTSDRERGTSPENETPKGRPGVHQDEQFIKRFGWLVSRFRADRWWFPAVYLFVQLVRACILGGGGTNNNGTSNGAAAAQVVILLLLDIITLVLYGYWRPFEGRRNMIMGVWILCSARVLVSAVCIALLPQVNISRIGATVVGFVIVIIQVLELLAVVGLSIIGVVTSWISMTRNKESIESEALSPKRTRYLERLDASAAGLPPPPKRPTEHQLRRAERKAKREAEILAASLPPPEPSFNVIEVRRAPKIEDLEIGGSDSEEDRIATHRSSRAGSVRSRAGSYTGSRTGSMQRGSLAVRDNVTIPFPVMESTSAAGASQAEASSAREGAGEDANGNSTAPSNINTDDDEADENDIVGDLGEHTAQAVKRRRANSAGNSILGVGAAGPQIFDPSRVIARHNRSRTNSMTSLHSLQSVASLHPIPGVPAGTGTPGPSRPVSMASLLMFPPVDMPVDLPAGVRATTTTIGPIADRMTPTREILRRHASERWSYAEPPPLPPSLDELDGAGRT